MEVKLTREEVEELILEGLAARHPTLPPIREITYHSYGVERPRVWWEHATIHLAELEASAVPAPEPRDVDFLKWYQRWAHGLAAEHKDHIALDASRDEEAAVLPAPEQRDMENSYGVAVTFLQDELEKLRRVEETQHAAQTTPHP